MALHSFYFDVIIYFQSRWRHCCRNMELVKFGRGLGCGSRFCWLEHLQIWNWITSKRKDKRKWWRDAPPWVCLKARNGIRYTFYFVPFSNFGTYSAHTEWKIGGGGPKFFSFLNWVEDNWPHTDESEAAGTLSKEKKDCTCFHTCIWWRTYKSWAGEDHLHTHNLRVLVGFADSLVNLQALLAFHAITSKFVSTSKSC